MPEIALTRPTDYRVDRLRAYRIFIDGKKMARIKPGETKVFTVAPGQHDLQLKIDWASSERLRVNIGDSDRAEFVCAPQITQNEISFKVGFKLIYLLTLKHKRYISLHLHDEQTIKTGSEVPTSAADSRG
jgi:hypothetical protein